MGFEIGQHAADGLALAHAAWANFRSIRKQQLAGGATLLVLLLRLQTRIFPGRFHRPAAAVLLSALGFFQIRRVALDVVDILCDAAEFELLRVGVAQNFGALTIHGGEQGAATDERLGAGRLDFLQPEFHARREAISV